MYIGSRIRELRKQRKLKLYELAEKSGVQIATLSRIEHNKMTGTLESHLQIAAALGVELSELYTSIVRGNETNEPETETTAEIFVHNEKASFEILTKNVSRKKMMPMRLKIEPGGRTASETNIFGSEIFIYIFEGILEAVINEKPFTLEKNHCLYFDAAQPHFFRNTFEHTCKALVIATPAQL